MALIGTFSGEPRYEVGPFGLTNAGGGIFAANEYSVLQELLYKLPDNVDNLIRAKDVRDSVYTLWYRTSEATTYTNNEPTPKAVGGIDLGSTFSNFSMQQMWDLLLYPYVLPLCYIDNNWLSYNVDNTREYGDSTTVNLSWSVDRRRYQIQTITVDGISITPTGEDQSGSQIGTASQFNPTTFTISTYDGTQSVSNTTTTYWLYATYWGKWATFSAPPLTISVDKPSWADGAGVGSGKALKSSISGTYDGIDGDGNYVVFAWPTSFGTPTFRQDGLTNTAWTKIVSASSAYNMHSWGPTPYDVWISNTAYNSPVTFFSIT